MSDANNIPSNLPQKRAFTRTIFPDYSSIKKLIWVYFLLLLFEGALRKWFLPSLSQGLLIIRDPIAVWIYFLTFQNNIFPLDNKYLKNLFIFTLMFAFVSFFFAGTHWATVAYGFRTNLLHFPLIFIMARVMNLQDVILIGKVMMILALPMTFIVAEQFQADREDIINVGAGGSGYQLETSGGKVRASGTFSFVTGIVFFYCFTISFVIHGFISKNLYNKTLPYLGAGATLLAMVTAGSRSVIADCLQVVACFGFLAYFKPNEFGKITASVFGLSSVAIILYSQLDLFKEGIEFLSLRFEEAANVEGNPIEAFFNRYLEILMVPYHSLEFEIIGNGLGSATRAGSTFGGYTWSENAWRRAFMEGGLFFGFAFIIWRIWITKDLLILCIKAVKSNNHLPIFLFGATGPILLLGILGQPTNLGFVVFGAGLCLAACKSKKEIVNYQ
jgi:hypothetical protein